MGEAQDEPEEIDEVIRRLARQHVQLELGMRSEETHDNMVHEHQHEPEHAPPGRHHSDRRTVTAPVVVPRRGGPRGWDDSPVAAPALPVMRTRAALLAWPQTKVNGLPKPDGPLPWLHPAIPAPKAAPRRRPPTAPAKRKAPAAPAPSRHAAAEQHAMAQQEAQLFQLSERTIALLHELDGGAAPAAAASKHMRRGAAARTAGGRGGGGGGVPPSLPLSRDAASQLLEALRAAQAQAREVRARWLTADEKPSASAAAAAAGARPLQRWLSRVEPAAPPGDSPSRVSGQLVERVLEGRRAFAEHKRGAQRPGVQVTRRAGLPAQQEPRLVEALAERLLGEELRALAKRFSEDGEGEAEGAEASAQL